MKVTNVQIFDQRIRSLVEAEMLEDPGDDYIETVDALWSVYKRRILRVRRAAGNTVPEHNQGFYANTCQMVTLGHDPKYDGLVYFESVVQ